jgi:hypothetical protein
LAIASSRVASSKSPFRFVAPDAGCHFSAAAFDTDGIAAIETCGQAGGTTRLLQLNHHRQVVRRINLAPGRTSEVTVVNDPQANTALISEALDASRSTRIWTFDGTHLRLIRRFIGNPLLAQP